MRVLVVACGHCGIPESFAEVDLGPGVLIEWRPSLCDETGAVLRDRREPGLAVIFLGMRDFEQQAALAEEATHLGIHPLHLRFLDAARLWRDPRTLLIHTRAAIVRLRSTEGAEGEPLRQTNRFRGSLPRRSFLFPRPRFHAPLPRIEPSLCRAPSGCDLCVTACPEEAISRGHPPRIDPSKCTSCAACLPSCPTGAVGHPELSFEGLEAEAEALVDVPHLNLLVVCTPTLLALTADELPADPQRWRLLEVPALVSLRPLEILRLRSKGFDRVVGLSKGRCCPGAPGPFGVIATLLEGLGRGGPVGHWDLEDGPLPKEWSLPLPENSPQIPVLRSLAEIVVGLEGSAGNAIPVPGRGAGFVALNVNRCTLCGLCAGRCWSRALALEEPELGRLRLTFDHLSCDGCGLCGDVCPEEAIQIDHIIEPIAVGQRRVLKEDSWVLCRSCGTRVAPRSMMTRIAVQLKTSANLDLCPDCKPLAIV